MKIALIIVGVLFVLVFAQFGCSVIPNEGRAIQAAQNIGLHDVCAPIVGGFTVRN